MNSSRKAIELIPLFRERVWGRKSLEPYFSELAYKHPIGEVWFTFGENLTSRGKSLGELLRREPELLGTGADPQHPDICPILVKLLFTTERLSIQVHPDDAYALKNHGSLGKTEAWYVLDSQPPGEVAVGFKQPLQPDQLAEAAHSGRIVDLLDWRKVEAGDVIFTPAGTVHAIGAGLTICEIQQNSDVTYRLYDYGRPRELHLDHGAKVSHLGPHTHESVATQLAPGRNELATSQYFRIESIRPDEYFHLSGMPHYLLAICTKGTGTLEGKPVRQGQAFFFPAESEETLIEAAGSEWIVTYTADRATDAIVVH